MLSTPTFTVLPGSAVMPLGNLPLMKPMSCAAECLLLLSNLSTTSLEQIRLRHQVGFEALRERRIAAPIGEKRAEHEDARGRRRNHQSQPGRHGATGRRPGYGKIACVPICHPATTFPSLLGWKADEERRAFAHLGLKRQAAAVLFHDH